MLIKQKQLFNKEECDIILSYGTLDVTNWLMGDRKYDSQPINHSSETDWVFEKLRSFFESETNIKVINIKKQIHFHKFIKGDWFGKHSDNRDNRLYAVGVLLNETFSGGDFILYNPNQLILNKVAGNAYIFDVTIEHEISPILDGERYSLLWFLQSDHIKLKVNKLI